MTKMILLLFCDCILNLTICDYVYLTFCDYVYFKLNIL